MGVKGHWERDKNVRESEKGSSESESRTLSTQSSNILFRGPSARGTPQLARAWRRAKVPQALPTVRREGLALLGGERDGKRRRWKVVGDAQDQIKHTGLLEAVVQWR